MDLFDVVRSCARRWYIFLPLMLITSWVSYDVYSGVKPVYYSQAVIGLTPPNTKVINAPQGVALPRNGILEVGGAIFIANMTAVGLREPAVVDRVVGAGGLPDYNARMFPVAANMPQLPLIMVEATNADPEAVTKTLDIAVTEAELTLRGLQESAQVPPDQMVTPFVVAPPSKPEAGMPSRTRSTLALFLAGAALSVLVTVLLDVMINRFTRRPRRSPQADGPEIESVPIPARPDTDRYLQESAADGARSVR